MDGADISRRPDIALQPTTAGKHAWRAGIRENCDFDGWGAEV